MAAVVVAQDPPSEPATRQGPVGPRGVALCEIPWDLYVRLCDADDRRKVRMAYLDGVLALMSPEYVHDGSSRLLGLFINVVSETLDIPCTGTGSTTLRRGGEEPGRGAGKEPDQGFYFANEPAIRGKKRIGLDIDPPPDLAIEVDNANDSTRSFPIYARLGVPELWVYVVETGSLWFGRLQADGTYAPIDRSLSLPMLTPALVLQGLKLAESLPESRWTRRLRAWVEAGFAPPPAAP